VDQHNGDDARGKGVDHDGNRIPTACPAGDDREPDRLPMLKARVPLVVDLPQDA
jgi:hypothetical protein